MNTPRRLAALERLAAASQPSSSPMKAAAPPDYEKIGLELRAIRITHTRPRLDTPADEVERNCRRYAEQSFAFYNCGKPTDHAWIDRMTRAYTDDALSLNSAEYAEEWHRYWPGHQPAGATP